jgi:CheY-like chemotaxis protein
MKILIVEDRGIIILNMTETLMEGGHFVTEAMKISDAINHYEIGKYDCLIVDLNMDNEGLSKEQRLETEAGKLTGWIWLKYHVYNVDLKMRQRTIIYSEYIPALTKYCRTNNETLEDIYVVAKKGSSSPASKLINYVNAITNLKNEQNGGH